MTRISHRTAGHPVRWQHALLALVAILVLAACGTTAPQTSGSTYSPVLAVSELTVGPNRIALGIIKDGTPVNDPNLTVRLRIFDITKPDATIRSEAAALYRGQGLPFGLYVAYVDFDTPGSWGLEVETTEAGQPPQTRRMQLDVLESGVTPAVGSPAFPSRNLTAREVPELTQLTSDGTPDPDLYQRTIADTLAAKRPFLVAFSTPGFCKTAVCSPNLAVIKQVKAQFQGQVDFIHVEVYPYPFGESAKQQIMVPTMAEWHLTSEPWAFLVDANGIIQAKYEGGLTLAELQPALAQLAAGQPITPPTS